MAETEENKVPEWVVLYGGLMSLLLGFFIMLVSMSETKRDGKHRAMMDGIRKAFGPTKGKMGVPGRSFQKNSAMTQPSSRGGRSEGWVKSGGRTSIGSAGAHRAVARINQGTMVTLGGPARFGRFDAILTDELKKNLEIIARVVGPKPHLIIVRGHATPEPIPSDSEILSTVIGCSLPVRDEKATTRLLTVHGLQIQDQFDLSFARARAVADFLLAHNIPKHRILVSASGDTEQRLLTRRKAGQNLNRRVDVFLVDSYISRPKSGGSRVH